MLKSIDLDTQKTIWTITIPDVSKKIEYLSSANIISRKQLKITGVNLFIEDHNKIVCVNRQIGEVRWRYENAYWGGAVDYKGEHIYIDFEREIKSLNVMSGRQEWTVSMESDIQLSPISYRDLIFVVCRDGILYALQANSGNVIWKYHLSKAKFPRISKPIIQKNTIVLSVDRNLVALDLSGKKLWDFNLQGFLRSDIRDILVLDDGYLISSFYSIFRYTTEKRSDVIPCPIPIDFCPMNLSSYIATGYYHIAIHKTALFCSNPL